VSSKPVQLTLDGEFAVPSVRPRAGAIGKVERAIEARPWLTCGEIAIVVDEPASRVSEALNKLKREGKAQQREGLGQSRRSVWAGTSEAGRELRDRRLAEVIQSSDDDAAVKLAARFAKSWQRAGVVAPAVLA
jgi:hypothetical protein